MSTPLEAIAKKVAAELANAGVDGVMRVRLFDIAKSLGLEFKSVLTRARTLKIATSGEPSSELRLSKAEELIEQLLFTHPEIVHKPAPKPAINFPKSHSAAVTLPPASDSDRLIIVD